MVNSRTLIDYRIEPDCTILLKILPVGPVLENTQQARYYLSPSEIYKYIITAKYGVNRRCRFYCPATYDDLIMQIWAFTKQIPKNIRIFYVDKEDDEIIVIS